MSPPGERHGEAPGGRGLIRRRPGRDLVQEQAAGSGLSRGGMGVA